MALDKAKIVDELSNATVIEIADLVKELESKWGVSAAAPVAAAAFADLAAASVALAVAVVDFVVADPASPGFSACPVDSATVADSADFVAVDPAYSSAGPAAVADSSDSAVGSVFADLYSGSYPAFCLSTRPY